MQVLIIPYQDAGKCVRPFFLFLLLIFTGFAGIAQSGDAREWQVKGAFVYNFALFTEWPPESLGKDGSPFVIGVMGADPLAPVLEEIVRGENIHGHPIEVRNIHTPEEARPCHILFLKTSPHQSLEEITAELGRNNVLTVSDMSDFTGRGGMIKLYIENNKLRFEVNMNAVRQTRLVLSSRLLRLASLCCEDP